MLYPLKFQPIYKEKIWGGKNLMAYCNKDLSGREDIGESWEIADHYEDNSIILNGELKGRSLNEALKEFKRDLVGTKPEEKFLDRFPLLIKFIDAHDKLSVQVHPDDQYAELHEKGEYGKTEMWYVVHADRGAKLIMGLNQNVTPDEFKHHLETNDVEDILQYVEVKTGDVLFIPAGRIHAILPGVVIYEVQQNSDLTYRVYDWGRMGFDNQPRPLHIEKSIQTINFRDVNPNISKIHYSHINTNVMANLTHCLYFHVEKYLLNEKMKFISDRSTFSIFSVMDGFGLLNWENREIELNKGDTVLIPAVLASYTIYPQPLLTLVRSCA
ncbi:MAG: mannose-6-phosphate isomerase, class I [bacterium]|nr:mannose-6-phosphate isomerase, class I [bacterium]